MKSREQDFSHSPLPCHCLPYSVSSNCYDYATKPRTDTCSEVKTWAGDRPGTPAHPVLLEPRLERSNSLKQSLDGSKDREVARLIRRWNSHTTYEDKILNRALGNKFASSSSDKARSSPQGPVQVLSLCCDPSANKPTPHSKFHDVMTANLSLSTTPITTTASKTEDYNIS